MTQLCVGVAAIGFWVLIARIAVFSDNILHVVDQVLKFPKEGLLLQVSATALRNHISAPHSTLACDKPSLISCMQPYFVLAVSKAPLCASMMFLSCRHVLQTKAVLLASRLRLSRSYTLNVFSTELHNGMHC